jgi:hypothetical protein
MARKRKRKTRPTVPEAEQALVKRFERKGYKVVLNEYMPEGMVWPDRKLCRYGHPDNSVRLSVLAHEFAHTVCREPKHHGSDALSLSTGRLFGACRYWIYEWTVWEKAEEIIRKIDPKEFSWHKFYGEKRRVFKESLRSMARCL